MLNKNISFAISELWPLCAFLGDKYLINSSQCESGVKGHIKLEIEHER